jgi:hypothetical protein
MQDSGACMSAREPARLCETAQRDGSHAARWSSWWGDTHLLVSCLRRPHKICVGDVEYRERVAKGGGYAVTEGLGTGPCCRSAVLDLRQGGSGGTWAPASPIDNSTVLPTTVAVYTHDHTPQQAQVSLLASTRGHTNSMAVQDRTFTPCSSVPVANTTLRPRRRWYLATASASNALYTCPMCGGPFT